MRVSKGLVLFALTFIINNVLVEANPFNFEQFLNDAEVDKESQNLVDDVAHFVVNKVESATQSIGANGILDPVKFQEFVTSALGQGTQWLSDKTSSFYERIKKKVSEWWAASTRPKGEAVASQEDYSEEVVRQVVKKILSKVEDELKSKNITGIENADIEKWILPVVKKLFGDLFGFPVKLDENL